jgi:hypothetical protein
MRKLLLVAILVAAFLCTAAAPRINRTVEYPPFYSLYGNGNCVWFAWLIVHQETGIELPWAGDAKKWVNLAGREVTVSGKVYTIEAVVEPVPGSIYVNTEGRYGHVAWVYAVDNVREWGQADKVIFRTLESNMYPPDNWQLWMGCYWKEKERVWAPGEPGVLFLVFR